MENNQKGICINIGNCNQADKKVVQELPVTADFICSECGRDLTPIVEKKKFKLKKPLLIAIPIIILFIIGGYLWYYFNKAKAIVETTEAIVNTAQKSLNKSSNKTDLQSSINTDSTLNNNYNNSSKENQESNTTSVNGNPTSINKINSKTEEKKNVASNNVSPTNLKDVLLGIANTNLTFQQRIFSVDKAMTNVFSKDFVVETYINKAGVASHLWDKGHGKDYLEHLAMEQTIVDFKILAHTGSMPNVTYLQVIEVHKQ
jgi:hypothetical protein